MQANILAVAGWRERSPGGINDNKIRNVSRLTGFGVLGRNPLVQARNDIADARLLDAAVGPLIATIAQVRVSGQSWAVEF